jgi:hypothetical protein
MELNELPKLPKLPKTGNCKYFVCKTSSVLQDQRSIAPIVELARFNFQSLALLAILAIRSRKGSPLPKIVK